MKTRTNVKPGGIGVPQRQKILRYTSSWGICAVKE
jgi:hypothetical protein